MANILEIMQKKNNVITDEQFIKAYNYAFDLTPNASFRQRMAAVLLNSNGEIIAEGVNEYTAHWYMTPENGYRKDQVGAHCELAAIRNYCKKHDIDDVNKDKFFKQCKKQDFNTIIVVRRKGGICSLMKGNSKPCIPCQGFLKKCGIKFMIYYDEKVNHFVKEPL